MAASMWRMNGLWRRMAGVLVLCTLLLSNKVVCQDTAPSTTVPTAASPTDPAAPADPADPADPAVDVSVDAEAPAPTAAPTVGDAASVASGEDSAPSAAPGDNPIPATIITIFPGDDSKDIDTSSTTGTTIAPLGRANRIPAIAEVPDESHFHRIVPSVQCVGKEDIPESNAVRAVVVTDNCEATKHIIQENPASWCRNENCNLEIFQDGNTVLVSSKDAGLGALAAALQSEHLKDKLGVTKTETPSSAGSSVFVGILVSGLLAALGITVGYFKCQRRPDPKGVRLAEEAYPVDQENQANTLVSVAPLNPPPETQEKPSVNGESPEAAKTQPPPPTNGHSTAKTADTEL